VDHSVSVIIAVHNGERYLAQAMSSVLAQTLRPAELIVVDDGSTDASAEIAETHAVITRAFRTDTEQKPRRVCVRQAHSGQPSALNAGVRRATGTLLAFLDADDLWQDDKLSHQSRALQADPRVDMVFGLARQFRDPPGQATATRALLPAKVPGAILIRREAFERVGEFREDLSIGSAIEWYSRASDLGLREIVLDAVVLERRIHGANLTMTASSAKDYTSLVRTILTRRRGTT